MSDDDGNDDNVLRFPFIERIGPISADPFIVARGGRPMFYRLVNRQTVPINGDWSDPLLERYTISRETGIDPWRVAFTEMGNGVSVSTVFLGLDHNFICEGPPLLFETMVFGGRIDLSQGRCSTYDEAEAMHAETVERVRSGHLRVVK